MLSGISVENPLAITLPAKGVDLERGYLMSPAATSSAPASDTPPPAIIEYSLPEGFHNKVQPQQRKKLFDALSYGFGAKFRAVKLPAVLPYGEFAAYLEGLEGNPGTVYALVTPTKSTPILHAHALHSISSMTDVTIAIGNQNQDSDPRLGGWIRATEMRPLVLAGMPLCLDLSNLLWSQIHGCRSEREWIDRSQAELEAFLTLPISICHISSVSYSQSKSHLLGADIEKSAAFDVKPWLAKIAAKNSNVIFIADSGHYSVAEKLRTIRALLD